MASMCSARTPISGAWTAGIISIVIVIICNIVCYRLPRNLVLTPPPPRSLATPILLVLAIPVPMPPSLVSTLPPIFLNTLSRCSNASGSSYVTF